MQWLQSDCPQDLVLRVLAFAGPQTASALSKTNRYWKEVMDEEQTWRVLCEQLYKWTPSDETPASWKDYYRLHPCIPVDFPSVGSALETLFPSKPRKPRHKVHSSVHFLFRPGAYSISRTILVRGAHKSVQVTFEKLNSPATSHLKSDTDVALVYDGLKANYPLFCVEGGTLLLRDLRLVHQSTGFDLWAGNAAVQVQARKRLAHVSMERCDVTSKSGRGIVVSNGGKLTLHQCNVHSCAATGIYMSGSNSTAKIASTDIIGNGNGRRGLAGGHSGVYLQDGVASIHDSNISHNSSAGIYMVTREEWRLNLSDSDLVGNGALQLNLPARNVAAHGHRLNILEPRRRSELSSRVLFVPHQVQFEELVAT